jgi:hypothetical protein
MGGAAMMTGVPLGELTALVQANLDGVLGCIDSRAILLSRACPVDDVTALARWPGPD